MWLSRVLFFALALYAGHALWTLGALFAAPKCSPETGARCLRPRLAREKHDLLLFAGPPRRRPALLLRLDRFDPNAPFTRVIPLEIPRETRSNGTLNLYVSAVSSTKRISSWEEAKTHGSIEEIPLVTYMVPQATAFNLLREEASQQRPRSRVARPVSHLKTTVSFSILADPILLPALEIPAELYDRIRITNNDHYMPIIQYNFLKNKLSDLVELKKDSIEVNVTVEYAPASIGKMKFLAHIFIATKMLTSMGFSEKEIDDVKGLFADTNFYLLCVTIIISSFHLLFDILSFKNDISFWRAKKSMEGLSTRTVLWRAFSQSVITLYLFDENTSLLVLVPAVVATFIELWKVKKILHVAVEWNGRNIPKLKIKTENINKAEEQTRAVDAEAMRYLSYILYPICIIGAIYSLIYHPHKSWYSWTLDCIVKGVYAFGFLFMLPQLFINYKLKSVAALPWRAFMYKAFNTFIDDIFAFMITMPVAHRVACFRDDIVFIIYLYQRWLYPVDKSRIDDSYSIQETVSETHKKVD